MTSSTSGAGEQGKYIKFDKSGTLSISNKPVDKVRISDLEGIVTKLGKYINGVLDDDKTNCKEKLIKIKEFHEITQNFQTHLQEKVSGIGWNLTHRKSNIKIVNTQLKKVEKLNTEIDSLRPTMELLALIEKNGDETDLKKIEKLINNGADPTKEIGGITAFSIARKKNATNVFGHLYDQFLIKEINQDKGIQVLKNIDHAFETIDKVWIEKAIIKTACGQNFLNGFEHYRSRGGERTDLTDNKFLLVGENQQFFATIIIHCIRYMGMGKDVSRIGKHGDLLSTSIHMQHTTLAEELASNITYSSERLIIEGKKATNIAKQQKTNRGPLKRLADKLESLAAKRER